MGWATHAVVALQAGEEVEIRPRGHSMKGRVADRALVRLAPCAPETLAPNDVVLVRVRGRVYLHLIKAQRGERFLIGNNVGGTNGWVNAKAIFGRAVFIEAR